ncbi:hypothetical protein DFH11DRAFT_1591355 [Phellopilus nigrolimitatus]|nr:hypothetical protein DFH11DRAFT_1591355 [Phellopilus nigrolimitatus]
MRRCKHVRPPEGSFAFAQGQDQAGLALERFHYLRASILGLYDLQDGIAPDLSMGQLFPRQGLDFSKYTDFKLKPVTGIKLHPRDDGTIHPEDVKVYHQSFKDDWKMSEGGVLYFIGDPRSFYNIILNYHSPAKTTGSKEWDKLFARLKAEGFPKNLISCMFFARPSGCLNASCPFLHDAAAAEAARKRVLEKRRDYMLNPTPKQRAADNRRQQTEYRRNQGLSKDAHLSDDVLSSLTKPRARLYCSNPACAFPWLTSDLEDDPPLMQCSRCKWSTYCSPECQRADWARHKKEPCAPLEEIVSNDDFWSPIGTRKGTESLNIDWGGA